MTMFGLFCCAVAGPHGIPTANAVQKSTVPNDRIVIVSSLVLARFSSPPSSPWLHPVRDSAHGCDAYYLREHAKGILRRRGHPVSNPTEAGESGTCRPDGVLLPRLALATDLPFGAQ